jgi:hypothetical protein
MCSFIILFRSSLARVRDAYYPQLAVEHVEFT